MIKLKGVKQNMIANNLIPASVEFPGVLLKEELASRGISQRKFASSIGIPYSVISDITKGKRGINTKYALLFDAALGIESSLWLKLQADYDLFTAKRNKSFMRQLNDIRKVAAVI